MKITWLMPLGIYLVAVGIVGLSEIPKALSVNQRLVLTLVTTLYAIAGFLLAKSGPS